MNKSSKLKKIVSFFIATLVALNVCVLPVFAYSNPAGEWTDGEDWHDVYEDFSQCPKYTAEDLVYTGVTSENVTESFNIKKEYGLDWVTDSGCYMSQPFCLRRRWDYGDTVSNVILNFETNYSVVKQLFKKETFEGIDTVAKNHNLNMADYDVYYTLRTSYSVSSEFGFLTMTYVFVPKGHRLAISNENCPPDGIASDIQYGLWLSSEGISGVSDESYKQCWKYSITYGTEGGSITKSFGKYDNAFESWLGRSHLNLVATNIPIFASANNAKIWIMTGDLKEDPTNKIPNKSVDTNKQLSADKFYWKSFDCDLVQYGDSYRFIFKYVPGISDMVSNPGDYFFDVEYSQNVKYKLNGQTSSGEVYKSRSTSAKKSNALDTGGTTVNTFDELNIKAFDGSDTDGSSGAWFRFSFNNLLHGTEIIQGSTDLLSSYLYLTVTLKHKRFSTSANRNPNDAMLKTFSDISSDVRHFKFDAITGELLDLSDVTSDVITKDVTDSDGNIITDSDGNPIKQVSQIITNDNSTHTTINNYYYDADGKESTSADGSDVLSNILSTLIKFIKTLVTEGLPAALEILKTLISSVSGIVSDALSNIDIGTGTTNGILVVFKALPAGMWSLLMIGILVLVVVGIINRIF